MAVERAEIFNDSWPRVTNMVKESRIISTQQFIAEFKIHGKRATMSIEEFTTIFLDETLNERHSPFQHGEFKIVYSPTVDHCQMFYCVPAKRRKGEVKPWDVINSGAIYPGKKPPVATRFKFFLRCQGLAFLRTL